MKNKKFPSSAEIRKELARVRYRRRYRKTLYSTLFALLVAAAIAVLVATLWLPVLQIFGASMEPTLEEGQIVVSLSTSELESGDVVAFYYGNRVLVKRCIAGPGAWVDVQPDGTVLVNGVVLDEPYIQEKAFGICDIEFPYQVPDGTYFLMGDQRNTSVDSRHSTVGCISQEDIIGKIVFRAWPLSDFGAIE